MSDGSIIFSGFIEMVVCRVAFDDNGIIDRVSVAISNCMIIIRTEVFLKIFSPPSTLSEVSLTFKFLYNEVLAVEAIKYLLSIPFLYNGSLPWNNICCIR